MRKHRTRSYLAVVAIIAATALGLSLTAGAASGQANNGRSVLAGSRPTWANSSARRSAANPDDHLTFRVYTALRDNAGAEKTAAAVSDPKSPSYRHYLSAADVKNRFAATDATVASVKSWLRDSGFAVGYVPPNNLFVEATGTVAQAQRAFGVSLGEYDVRGQRVRAADGDLTVPTALAASITGVIGVDQSLALVRPDNTNDTEHPSAGASANAKAAPAAVPPGDGFRNAPPCSRYWAQHVATVPAYPPYGTSIPYAPCGYVPRQLRSVYGINGLVDSGHDGTGTTVAIVDAFASPTILADAQRYAQLNDPSHPFLASKFHQIVFPANPDLEGPDECDAAGWYGEETLDIEAVHGMAPGANILYVGGSDCEDVSIDKALNEVISKQLAPIVSNSYGNIGEEIPFSEIQSFQNMAVQAVIQGIGVYFSSGDDGDEVATLGYPAPDFSASSQWVTAVGGTSLGVGQAGNRVFETGWETAKSTLDPDTNTWDPFPAEFLYGSGGGTSRLFPTPFYQQGVVPHALTVKNHPRGGQGRVVPDISMVGDPNTGMLVGITQTFPSGVYYDQYRIGGTSLSSPLFAGLMAVADATTGVQHGFVNPTLYSELAGTSAIRDVTHVNGADVRVDYVNGINGADGTLTSIRTFDFQGLRIHTTPGYDDVTGLGTPNGVAFINALG